MVMLFENLKRLTHKQHQEAEELNFTSQIFAQQLSLDEYKKLLERNYYFNLAIEAQIENLTNYTDIKLSPLIAEDLKLLHISLDQPQEGLTPKSNDEILGYLYVRNGSVLGTKVIAKQLLKTEGLKTEVSKFNFYSPETGYPNWKDTMTYIGEHFKVEADVIKGATEAFNYFLALSKSE